MRFISLSIMALGLSAAAGAQNRDPLIIQHADRFEYFDREGQKYQRLIGHVEIHYKDTRVFSDTTVNFHNQERMEFTGRARMDYGAQMLSADKIVYFKKDSSATVTGHVRLTDREKTVTITGGRGDYSREREESRIWEKPRLVKVDSTGKDTLTIVSRIMRHLGGDKAALAEDSVVMTQGAIRATCNRARYLQKEEVVVMFDNPRVYQERNAVKGDTIVLYFRDEALEKMNVFGHASGRFVQENGASPDSEQITIISGDTLIAYVRKGRIDRMEVLRHAVGLSYLKSDTLAVNRMAGRYMEFFISGNAVDSTYVCGNAQSLYYYEEAGEKGRNETSGDTLNIYFLDKAVHEIAAKGNVKGVYYKNPR